MISKEMVLFASISGSAPPTQLGYIKIRRKIVPCPFWCYGANPKLHRMRFRIPKRLINALIFNRNVLFAC